MRTTTGANHPTNPAPSRRALPHDRGHRRRAATLLDGNQPAESHTAGYQGRRAVRDLGQSDARGRERGRLPGAARSCRAARGLPTPSASRRLMRNVRTVNELQHRRRPASGLVWPSIASCDVSEMRRGQLRCWASQARHAAPSARSASPSGMTGPWLRIGVTRGPQRPPNREVQRRTNDSRHAEE